MRIAHLIFTGSIAALAMLTAPALAKNTSTHKIEDTTASSPASSSCQAYQQAPDGSWNSLPCQEGGASSQAQTQHRSASQSSSEDAR